AIRRWHAGERGAVSRRNDSGHAETRRLHRQVLQSPTLQVDEPALSRRMHHLQNKLTAVAVCQFKILVVLPRQDLRRCFAAVEFTSKPRRLLLCGTAAHRHFEKHRRSLSLFHVMKSELSSWAKRQPRRRWLAMRPSQMKKSRTNSAEPRNTKKPAT